MTAIVSSLGLLVLGCVLLCQSIGSEGVVRCDVVQGFPYPRLEYQCEGSDIVLDCTYNSTIKVVSACYGGDMSYCAPKARSCYASYTEAKYFSCVIEKVATQCDGQRRCIFRVSNRIFGEPPYPDKGISLEVKFNCKIRAHLNSQNALYAFVCENNTVSLQCEDSNQILKIKSARYGRLSTQTCKPEVLFGKTGNCYDHSDVRHYVAEKCDNKWDCNMVASNTEFNMDPCGEIGNQLEVRYYCQ